jgi:type II secretory pathway component GspD/PulD (secretin)
MVYPLHTASATTVAELLNRLFRRGGFGFSESSAVIEADQRLNAIIVYGGRNERATIERLLKLLDSEDVPESLVANRPTLIPVKNTSASRLERVIADIYKTQLTSGGVKQQIPVPSGATRDVAAVIQQINSAASGPMMTLGVDDTTNSIVVMAPGPLAREVKELVAELDEAALHDTSRGVRIVKLKSTNAMRVKEILDAVIRDATRRRTSSSSGHRP